MFTLVMILTEVMVHFLSATQNLLFITLSQCWRAQGSTPPPHIGTSHILEGCRGNKLGGVLANRDGQPRRNSFTYRKCPLNLQQGCEMPKQHSLDGNKEEGTEGK